MHVTVGDGADAPTVPVDPVPATPVVIPSEPSPSPAVDMRSGPIPAEPVDDLAPGPGGYGDSPDGAYGGDGGESPAGSYGGDVGGAGDESDAALDAALAPDEAAGAIRCMRMQLRVCAGSMRTSSISACQLALSPSMPCLCVSSGH